MPERWVARESAGQARPFPVFAASDEFGAEGDPLDVAEDRREVVIVLDREGLEPPLPDVAAGLVMPMVSLRVRRERPAHPPPEVAVSVGPDDRVEMVGPG